MVCLGSTKVGGLGYVEYQSPIKQQAGQQLPGAQVNLKDLEIQ